MSSAAWELLFMMLILKIPIAYLAFVVWYAIKAEPEPGVDPSEYSVWRPWHKPAGGKPDGPRRPRRGSPHGPREARVAERRAKVHS